MSWLPLAAILCASPPGIASQVAAVATPAPSADTVALVEIANQIVTGAPKYRPNYVTNIAVVNGYALVGYWDLRNEGGEFLAHKVNGTWHVLSKGGGAMDVSDIERYAPNIDRLTAKELFDRLGVHWSSP